MKKGISSCLLCLGIAFSLPNISLGADCVCDDVIGDVLDVREAGVREILNVADTVTDTLAVREASVSGELTVADIITDTLAVREAVVTGGNGSVELLIEADKDNIGEYDQPRITLTQDGGMVKAQIGFFNGTNDLTIKNKWGGAYITLSSDGKVYINGEDIIGALDNCGCL